jgi:hypothetical protein
MLGYIFLLLFGITLFVMYIAIRRAWGSTTTIGSIGAILSVLFVILFALLHENTFTGLAIFAGLVVGLGFSGAVVVIASFFRMNQPSADIQLANSQEDPYDEQQQ